MTDRKVENTIPVLGVAELAAAIRFYTEILGFRVDWGGEEGSAVCSVSRDGCSIMLMADPKNKRSCVWIGMEDDTLLTSSHKTVLRFSKSPRISHGPMR